MKTGYKDVWVTWQGALFFAEQRWVRVVLGTGVLLIGQ
jgi:hypothetical protein